MQSVSLLPEPDAVGRRSLLATAFVPVAGPGGVAVGYLAVERARDGSGSAKMTAHQLAGLAGPDTEPAGRRHSDHR